MALLEVRDLSVELQTHRGPAYAVRNVSFSLERGQSLGLIGESGCGKSITVMALMGLLPENARVTGSILFEGRELVGQPEGEMCKLRGDRIGMIFQEPMTALNPAYTIGDQLTEGYRRHKGAGAAQARERAVHLLGKVGIAGAGDRLGQYPHQLSGGLRQYPHELSGGMRQRVMIAIALACRPKLLIADEPTTALDVTIQAQILSLLRDLQRELGMAVLLITHDLGVVARYADRVNVMYAARIAEHGDAAPLFARPLHPYTAGLLRSVPRLDQP
ncbi:MAG TPA: ABC transporter ATP-binding protein, partial [Ramlibacter sp.]|nr:ABC transporter ATP-binding protein [Ramlibacter sp.]